MEYFRSILDLFDEFPYWVRYVVVIWLLATVTVVAVLVLFRTPSTKQETKTTNAPDSSLVTSYYVAARKGVFSQLDCRRFRIESQPNVVTLESTACEALAELRSNLKLLAQYRDALLSAAATTPPDSFEYSKSKIFFESFFEELPHGPYKRHFISLLEKMAKAGTELATLRTRPSLHQRQASAELTIDDLIIGNSFLDYVIGTEIKQKMPLWELVRLGPFYSRTFDPEVEEQTLTREFRDDSGKPMDFSYIVGLYD